MGLIQHGTTAWQTLAKINKLTFIPEHFLQHRARIVGEYRGYHLQLSHWTFGIEIILSTKNESLPLADEFVSNKPITLKSLKSLLLDPHLFALMHGYIRAEDQGRKFLYHQIGDFDHHENEVQQLQRLFDRLSDLADDYRQLVALGGEVVPALKLHGKKLNPLIGQLLDDIAADTTNKLGHRAASLLCSRCIVRCHAHRATMLELSSNIEITYYGCRSCYQSRKFIESQKVIAVLDEGMKTEQSFLDETLRVNWLMRRNPFDFDEVEIIQATDEDVERFAVQVGNNTEPIQKLSYKGMCCTIAPGCNLGQGTRLILARMFGRVEEGKRVWTS